MLKQTIFFLCLIALGFSQAQTETLPTMEQLVKQDGAVAIMMDSTNKVVRVEDSGTTVLDLSGPLTIEAWVNPSAYAAADVSMTIVNKENAYQMVLFGNGELRSSINTNRLWRLRGSAVVPLNRWSHVVVTYDGANVTHRINAVVVDSYEQSGEVAVNDEDFRIGAGGGDGPQSEPFNGTISRVALYNKALGHKEIERHFAVGNFEIVFPNVLAEASQKIEALEVANASSNKKVATATASETALLAASASKIAELRVELATANESVKKAEAAQKKAEATCTKEVAASKEQVVKAEKAVVAATKAKASAEAEVAALQKEKAILDAKLKDAEKALEAAKAKPEAEKVKPEAKEGDEADGGEGDK